MERLPLSDRMLEVVAQRFRVLGEPQRLRLLQALESGERTVNELVELTGAAQPNASRHLQALRDAGLVGRRKEGTSVYYSIADPMVFRLCELVCHSVREDARSRYADILAQPEE